MFLKTLRNHVQIQLEPHPKFTHCRIPLTLCFYSEISIVVLDFSIMLIKRMFSAQRFYLRKHIPDVKIKDSEGVV